MVSCSRLPLSSAAHMLHKLHVRDCFCTGACPDATASSHGISTCCQPHSHAPSATCTSCGMWPLRTLIILAYKVGKAQNGLEATKGSTGVAGWRLAAGRDGLWVGVRH